MTDQPSQPRSALAPFAHLTREPSPEEAWELCRAAWHNQGILCLRLDGLDTRIGWVAQRVARNLGEQAFGKRKAEQGNGR